MFESDFAKCEYIERDNVVFHVWKKEAHYDDYRNPVIASLEMLRTQKGSLFVVDARNGFEDVKEDVDWGFSCFLPELKKTGCSTWFRLLCNRGSESHTSDSTEKGRRFSSCGYYG